MYMEVIPYPTGSIGIVESFLHVYGGYFIIEAENYYEAWFSPCIWRLFSNIRKEIKQ